MGYDAMMPVINVTDMVGDLREEIYNMPKDFDRHEQDAYIAIDTVADEDVYDDYH